MDRVKNILNIINCKKYNCFFESVDKNNQGMNALIFAITEGIYLTKPQWEILVKNSDLSVVAKGHSALTHFLLKGISLNEETIDYLFKAKNNVLKMEMMWREPIKNYFTLNNDISSANYFFKCFLAKLNELEKEKFFTSRERLINFIFDNNLDKKINQENMTELFLLSMKNLIYNHNYELGFLTQIDWEPANLNKIIKKEKEIVSNMAGSIYLKNCFFIAENENYRLSDYAEEIINLTIKDKESKNKLKKTIEIINEQQAINKLLPAAKDKNFKI